jgi:hypothetical protein
MNRIEETIDATLDSNGQLLLSHQPQLLAGPVRVMIRASVAVGPRLGMADVIRDIAADQCARGFPGRSAAELCAPKTMRDWTRTPSGTGNWTRRAAVAEGL